MSTAAKDTVYIDAEDEITAIIEKVRTSEGKVVALVLPKRAQTLQSVVNLKLLKRTASEAKKNLVLITSDPNLLPIAGAVGLHVAKTPQSKPAVPATPARAEDTQNIETVSVDDKDDPEIDPSTPIGELAGEETIELDNETDAKPVAAVGAAKTKKLFNKKLKVPDFDRFRLLIFGGGALLILLIVGGIFAFVVLPKANIVIKTDTSSVSSDITLVARTDVTELDRENKLIPATKKELKKTENGKTPATGQRDDGTKATGVVRLTNCTKGTNQPITVPAGTGLTSNGIAFITTEAVQLPKASFDGVGDCDNDDFDDVSVTAQAAGGQSNISEGRTFAVSGFGGITGKNSAAMTGGTSKLVQVVSQADIDSAKQKLLEKLNTDATAELKAQFIAENFQPLDETYGAGEPVIASTPNVNDPASEVTVTVTISYTELGVKKDDLKTLIEESVNKQIDTSKQSIQDNGLDKATIRLLDKKSADEVTFSIQTISVAGPQLDTEGIKREIAGKKKGATVTAIQSRPGIKDVEINYSPFWVFSTPKRLNRINVTFDQASE